MPFEKTYTVASTRSPEKVYTSADEFWADHAPEVTSAANANAAFKADGRILSTSSTLNEDGKSLTYVKVFFDEEAWSEFSVEHAAAVTENLTVCTFTPI
tara:strand:+ start:19 stop:315 length:297 start_codon:yes stop_codon:yes gene_type:complete